MIKQTFKELLAYIETRPQESLAKGLARKILLSELLKPRHVLFFLSLPFGIYFAAKFITDLINNEVMSAVWLAISNFSLSFGYIADEFSFINAFFPYQTFAWMLVWFGIGLWSVWTLRRHISHIIRKNHII